MLLISTSVVHLSRRTVKYMYSWVGVANSALSGQIRSVGFKDLWLEDKDKDFPRGQQTLGYSEEWFIC